MCQLSNIQIWLKDVTFGYERETVLEHFDLQIRKGELVGIIGANGAGKSTMIRLILGQLTPWSGEVEVGGFASAQYGKWYETGYVPQRASSQGQGFPATVEEVVMMGLYKEIGLMRFPKKEHDQRVNSALITVNMQEYKKRLIYKLSGGQQQRVMIAKALVNNPKLLLLDEPTTGVDPKSTEQLMQLLRHLNQEHGITIVVISHDVPILKKVATRLFELKEKRAVELTGEV